MDDNKIIQLFFARMDSAISALSKKYGTRLQRTALNILGDPQDAEEAVNDTYLALWNKIPPERPDPLGVYVCRVVRNIALKQLRTSTAQKRNNHYDLSLEELTESLSGGTLEETLDTRILGDAINHFLDTLQTEQRVLFVRRYWFGDSIRGIARDLGLTENATTVRLHRLRTQLKDYLYKEGIFL